MKVKYKKVFFFLLIIGLVTTLTKEGFSLDIDKYDPAVQSRRRQHCLQFTSTSLVILGGIGASFSYLWHRAVRPSFIPSFSSVIPLPDITPPTNAHCANLFAPALNSLQINSYQSYSEWKRRVEAESKENPAIAFELTHYKQVNETGYCLEYRGNHYKIDDSYTKYHHNTFWQGRLWYSQIGILTTAYKDLSCYESTFQEQVKAQTATCSLESNINLGSQDYLAFENLMRKYSWQQTLEVTDQKKAKEIDRRLEKFEHQQFVQVTATHKSGQSCVIKSSDFIPYWPKKNIRANSKL